jgi:hypothetical protein
VTDEPKVEGGGSSLQAWITALHHDFVIGTFRTAFVMKEAVTAAEKKRAHRDMVQRMNDMARQLGLEETASDPHGDENENALIELLESERRNDFPLYNGLTVVALWASLEAYLDDAMATALFWEPEFLEWSAVMKIKGPLLEFSRKDSFERCSHLVERLMLEASSSQPGVDRYDHVLHSLNLGEAQTEYALRMTLKEFYAVRNLFAHRRGNVDERFMKECPQFKAELADTLRLSSDRVIEYLMAGITYGNLVAKRILDAIGVKEPLVERLYDPKLDRRSSKRRKKSRGK